MNKSNKEQVIFHSIYMFCWLYIWYWCYHMKCIFLSKRVLYSLSYAFYYCINLRDDCSYSSCLLNYSISLLLLFIILLLSLIILVVDDVNIIVDYYWRMLLWLCWFGNDSYRMDLLVFYKIEDNLYFTLSLLLL